MRALRAKMKNGGGQSASAQLGNLDGAVIDKDNIIDLACTAAQKEAEN